MPDPATLRSAMPLVKERMKTLTEAPVLLQFLFDDLELNEKASGLVDKAPDRYLARVAGAFEGVDPWTAVRSPTHSTRWPSARVSAARRRSSRSARR